MPHLVAAITEQASKVWHVSNLFRIPEAERLAARLCEASFADTVFFTNSGAEAMECAIKTARNTNRRVASPIAFTSSRSRAHFMTHAGHARGRRHKKYLRRLRSGGRSRSPTAPAGAFDHRTEAVEVFLVAAGRERGQRASMKCALNVMM